jgi:hypothetical protein
MVDNDMYFIVIIADAFRQANRQAALKEAFEKIKSLGQKDEYKSGYEQFERFMAAVDSHTKKNKARGLWDNIVKVLITELATDTFEGTDEQRQKILEIITSNPKWQKEYESLANEVQLISVPFEQIEISILRDEKTINTVQLTKKSCSKVLDKILPGLYKIVLSTGRVLWEGQLCDNELIWSKVFEGKPIKMAADSGSVKAKPTKSINLLAGEISLNIFAGIEAGSLEIKMNL